MHLALLSSSLRFPLYSNLQSSRVGSGTGGFFQSLADAFIIIWFLASVLPTIFTIFVGIRCHRYSSAPDKATYFTQVGVGHFLVMIISAFFSFFLFNEIPQILYFSMLFVVPLATLILILIGAVKNYKNFFNNG